MRTMIDRRRFRYTRKDYVRLFWWRAGQDAFFEGQPRENADKIRAKVTGRPYWRLGWDAAELFAKESGFIKE